jgi:hypothetical protein
MTDHPPGGTPAPRPSIEWKRRAVSLGAAASLFDTHPLFAGQDLPLVVEARSPGLGLAGWAEGNRAMIEESLLRHGGIRQPLSEGLPGKDGRGRGVYRPASSSAAKSISSRGALSTKKKWLPG